MSNMPDFVKCKCLSEAMIVSHGEFIHFPYGQARIIEALGHIKIVDECIPQKVQDDTEYLYKKGFKGHGKRVAWIQNYSKNGGAEISGFRAVHVGISCGFDVVGCIIGESDQLIETLEASDIVIVNNLHAGNTEPVIEWLLKTEKTWVKYDHDCLETDPQLFQKSTLNIFISPMQLEHYVKQAGEEIRNKSIVLPLAFDVARWPLSSAPRIKDSIFIPVPQKCNTAFKEYMDKNPDGNFYVGGDDVPYTDMPKEYAKYETVFHAPDKICGGERVIFEAVLSGCKVITNENAGHTSHTFNWRSEDILRPILDNAVYEFWRKIDELTTIEKPIVKSQSFSFVTRCMGRKSFLVQSLPTWLKVKEAKEIIIVDWGMKEDLSDLLTDERITIIQVPNVEHYDMGKPINIAMRYCTSEWMFCIDSDVKINNNSIPLKRIIEDITAGRIPDNSFITNNRKYLPLNGTCIYNTKNLAKVNGFNEGLKTRGYDEVDAMIRLRGDHNTEVEILYPGMLEHIEHDDKARFENFQCSKIDIIAANELNKTDLEKSPTLKQKHDKILCNVVKKDRLLKGVYL